MLMTGGFPKKLGAHQGGLTRDRDVGLAEPSLVPTALAPAAGLAVSYKHPHAVVQAVEEYC